MNSVSSPSSPVRVWTAKSPNSSASTGRVVNNEARQKYDVLQEPPWFLNRIEDAFGPVDFLPEGFNPSLDSILRQGEDHPQIVFHVPPFSLAAKYLEASAEEVQSNPDSTILLLISARTEAHSWHDHVFGKAHVLFVRGPFRFQNLDRGLSAALICYGRMPSEAMEQLRDLGTFLSPAGMKACG